MGSMEEFGGTSMKIERLPLREYPGSALRTVSPGNWMKSLALGGITPNKISSKNIFNGF
jgi:hypothetical protein